MSPSGGKAVPAPAGAPGKDVGGVRRVSVALIRRMRGGGAPVPMIARNCPTVPGSGAGLLRIGGLFLRARLFLGKPPPERNPPPPASDSRNETSFSLRQPAAAGAAWPRHHLPTTTGQPGAARSGDRANRKQDLPWITRRHLRTSKLWPKP